MKKCFDTKSNQKISENEIFEINAKTWTDTYGGLFEIFIGLSLVITMT